ncbi:RNA polymerase-associated protein RapA [Spongorhabdus nitratireducens]
MEEFVPGQRWISDTEIEQGLGTVLMMDARMVTLLFPATGETRLYARHNSPLTRVIFNPGDRVESHDGQTMTVTEVAEKDGLLTYIGQDRDGERHELPETNLSNFIQFNKPQDRLLAGQIDTNSNFNLRYKTLQHNHRLCKSAFRGLLGPRAGLIPHQLHIANEVASRYAPRVLLADEVGLGKTIEAGLILHRQLITGHARRVLLIVPETLQHQWLVEMLRRFNLHFSLFDQERCRHTESDNPFQSEQLILVSLDFLRDDENARQQCQEAGWDTLIVDEAHHLKWEENKPSTEYELVEQLAQNTPSVLLLTATPEQLGQASHFARLRLLDPNRFYSLEAFREEQSAYEPVASAVQELLDNDQLPEEAVSHLQTLLGDQIDTLIQTINSHQASENRTHAREQLIRLLLDRHGTGRVMFRNTRNAISGFPGRLAQSYPLSLPELYSIAMEEAEGLEQHLYPELAYQQQIKLDDMDPWWKVDPRVDWLINLLKLLKKKKVLIICARAETVLDLENALRIRSGIPAAVFHEGMSIVERDRASAWFADEEYGAQTLICSEIGSEGRNFQFAHHLVLFDLPVNPDLLEQRIGRLDRIGQTQTIQIHAPVLENTAQSMLFRWYDEGMDAFNTTCRAGSIVSAELGDELNTVLTSGEFNSEDAEKLIQKTTKVSSEVSAYLEQGRDRLLELNSHGSHGSEQGSIVTAIQEEEESRTLKKYMEKLFDAFGVESEDHSKHCLIARPGSHMAVPSLPGLPEDGATFTFDRDMALAREDMQFLTWEHPLVSSCMETVMTGETGNTAVSIIKNRSLKPGTMLLEAIYTVEACGKRQLELDRYLPATPIRTLIDPTGKDLAAKVSFEGLAAQLQPLKTGTARKVVKSQRQIILALLQAAEASVKQQVPAIVTNACQTLLNNVTEEMKRLAALKQVNPNVRDEEIDFLKQRAAYGHQALQKAQLRLDAMRLVITT